MKIAMTGATGFVGGNLLDLALARGFAVSALTRRPQSAREGMTWIEGALNRPASLARLCDGAGAVVHVAGVINGDEAAFNAGNVSGTANMIAAAEQAGVTRFVHVSSLAAREPSLSAYGRSKAGAEALLAASALDWVAVRPPAIYGPGDREMLEFFRFARRGIVPLPPAGGRLSVIAVDDLCRLLLGLIDRPVASGCVYEPDDGRPGGWNAIELARAIGRAVGRRRVLPLPLPRGLLLALAAADRAVRRGGAKLTRDRVDYFCHPDWSADPKARPPSALWHAGIDTEAGLAQTAAWYRAAGWLE